MKSANGNSDRKTGAHVSTSGGYLKTLERVQALQGNCFQIFAGSPRIWQRTVPGDLSDMTLLRTAAGIDPLFIHASYLVNPASTDPEIGRKTVESLVFDLRFNASAGGAGVIVHPGSRQGPDGKEKLDAVILCLAEILEHSPLESGLLIENSAGQNGKVAGDLADIRVILDSLRDRRLGWCFDTCHGFAAGYRLSPGTAPAGKNDRGTAETVIDRLDLWESLRCIHVNDSRDPFGSGRDRHENLGRGTIPVPDLSHFLNLSGCRAVPLILEVPGFAGEGPDRENLELLVSLLEA